MDKAIVCALIDAQNALGDVSAELANTESTSIEYEVSAAEEVAEPNVPSEETLDIILQIDDTIIDNVDMAEWIEADEIILDTATFK